MTSKTKEVWKAVVGYEGYYEVSSQGRVKKVLNNDSKMIKQSNDKDGYKLVTLFKEKKRKMFRVHRLVALTFLKNPKNKKFVNHIDGVKFNNKVNNLEWCTQSENEKHAYRTGLKKLRHGSITNFSKLVESDVIYIIKSDKGLLELSKMFNVHKITIKRIKEGKTWRHLHDNQD